MCLHALYTWAANYAMTCNSDKSSVWIYVLLFCCMQQARTEEAVADSPMLQQQVFEFPSEFPQSSKYIGILCKYGLVRVSCVLHSFNFNVNTLYHSQGHYSG